MNSSGSSGQRRLLPVTSPPHAVGPARVAALWRTASTVLHTLTSERITSTAGLPDHDGLASQRASDILAMENDPPMLEMLRVLLEREGHTVDTAADGGEGLACLQQGRYRLLLLDLLTPAVDGLDVLQTLRAEPALRPPAVVVLAAINRRADVLAALEAGADDYIVKPLDVNNLVVRVNMWLRRAGPAAPGSPPGARVHVL